MGFTNDYALYPDDMEYATESFFSVLGNIFNKIIDAIKRFGGWLKERINNIKEIFASKHSQKTSTNGPVSNQNASYNNQNVSVANSSSRKAEELIGDSADDIYNMALALNKGLDILANTDNQNQITEIYGSFIKQHATAEKIIRNLTTVQQMTDISQKALYRMYIILNNVSCENSQMHTAVVKIQDLMKNSTVDNDRVKILEKFLNLHTKIRVCTEALLKRSGVV